MHVKSLSNVCKQMEAVHPGGVRRRPGPICGTDPRYRKTEAGGIQTPRLPRFSFLWFLAALGLPGQPAIRDSASRAWAVCTRAAAWPGASVSAAEKSIRSFTAGRPSSSHRAAPFSGACTVSMVRKNSRTFSGAAVFIGKLHRPAAIWTGKKIRCPARRSRKRRRPRRRPPWCS